MIEAESGLLPAQEHGKVHAVRSLLVEAPVFFSIAGKRDAP